VTRGKEIEIDRVSIIYSSKEGAGWRIQNDPTGVNFVYKEVHGGGGRSIMHCRVTKSGCYNMVHIKIHKNGLTF
jgi:hypothetical protein